MVGDVVAVQTVRVRLKIRRCIHVADSQRVEVRDNFPCLRKSEPAIELQSVGAGWDPCHVERSRDISQCCPSMAWSNSKKFQRFLDSARTDKTLLHLFRHFDA